MSDQPPYELVCTDTIHSATSIELRYSLTIQGTTPQERRTNSINALRALVLEVRDNIEELEGLSPAAAAGYSVDLVYRLASNPDNA